MEQDLGRSLHTLTARLDRAADAFLRGEAGLSYPRFLALFMVGAQGADTQRALAERLGISEPSVSRMARVLTDAGLLETVSDPAGGNRHRLNLTAAGEQIVSRWGGELERRLTTLVKDSGVPYKTYVEHTKRLLDQLDAVGSGQAGAVPARRTRTAIGAR
ncbi:MAG: MarR family winged helix-turn-helix transcriptional regulator [Solirubrobacteraceae bacterium]